MKTKWFLAMGVVLGLACASHAAVMEVTFTGSTEGSFNGEPFATSTSLLGLTFNGSTFNTTTSNGFTALGSNAGTPNFNNLGSFTLSPEQNVYNGSFTLQVIFTQPQDISGGNTAIFTANITGSVTTLTTGGVFVNFDNTPQVFTFENAETTGTFTLQVNDVSINAGLSAPITGTITASQVVIPEVSSIAPLALLLVAVGASELSRRKQRLAMTA